MMIAKKYEKTTPGPLKMKNINFGISENGEKLFYEKILHQIKKVRSLYERSVKHMRDSMTENDRNHLRKHLKERHPVMIEKIESVLGVAEVFEFKVLQRHEISLCKQLGEAIQIRKSNGLILNNKTDYNRCELPVSGVSRQKQTRQSLSQDREKQLKR